MTLTATCQTAFDPTLNMARQSLYRFAALALLDTKFSAWQQLQTLRLQELAQQARELDLDAGQQTAGGMLQAAAELLREAVACQSVELGVGELPADRLDPARVWARFPADAAEMNAMYERTFGLLVSAACPPYETEYINSKYTFQRSHTLADVSGYYRAFGLTTATLNAERADHIVLELEFMAFLLGKERAAYEAGQSQRCLDRAAVCRAAQVSFLTEHLGIWGALFAKLLRRENAGGYYEMVGEFLAALIPLERTLLDVKLPQPLSTPSQIEPPEACDGCQLLGDEQLGT